MFKNQSHSEHVKNVQKVNKLMNKKVITVYKNIVPSLPPDSSQQTTAAHYQAQYHSHSHYHWLTGACRRISVRVSKQLYRCQEVMRFIAEHTMVTLRLKDISNCFNWYDKFPSPNRVLFIFTVHTDQLEGDAYSVLFQLALGLLRGWETDLGAAHQR